MINIRSKDEIAKLEKAGEYLWEVKQIIFEAIKPGASTLELSLLAEKEIKKRGCKSNFKGYGGFPAVACISINEEMIHGIPKKDKIIAEGDIISVDLGLIYKGYHSDSAFTKGVGKISPEDQKLIDVARDAFYVGIDAIQPGARIGDIGYTINSFIKKKGNYFVPQNFTGHGIGTALHEEPYIPNYGQKGQGPLIKDGMVFAIEPMILQDSNDLIILEDKWTVVSKNKKNTSHYEHSIVIENGKARILTGGKL